jgi:hypothetical protein
VRKKDQKLQSERLDTMTNITINILSLLKTNATLAIVK